jgi:hypothetical protein
MLQVCRGEIESCIHLSKVYFEIVITLLNVMVLILRLLEVLLGVLKLFLGLFEILFDVILCVHNLDFFVPVRLFLILELLSIIIYLVCKFFLELYVSVLEHNFILVL